MRAPVLPPHIQLTSSSFDGIATAGAGERLKLSVTDFTAGASYEVLVDEVPINDTVTADGSGSFTAEITAPAQPDTAWTCAWQGRPW